MPLITVRVPGSTMLFADCSTLTFEQNEDRICDVIYSNALSGQFDLDSPINMEYVRHTKGANILFADGHAESLSPKEVMSLIPVPQY